MNSFSKAWTFLTLGALLLIYVGHTLAGREGVLWAVVISLSINCYVYFFGDRRALRAFPSRKLEGQDPWGLGAMLKELCARARLPEPLLLIVPSTSPQAFSVGHNWKSSRVFLTEELLETFSEKEIRAVLAYQITSIQQLHTFLYLVASLTCQLILAITGILDVTFRWIIGAKKESDFLQSHFFSTLIAPSLSFLLRLSIRKSYYATDAMAAELINDPRSLAEVLWKLDSYAATRPILVAAPFSHLFMVNPLTQPGWTRYFHVHPTVKSRILKLVGHYPI